MSMVDLDEKSKSVLAESKTSAGVGASPNPNRPSHGVMSYLIGCGWNVIPVRPRVAEVMGRKCYASLQDIPVPVDIVDVFRKAEACPDVARDAVAIGARLLWLQEGIISDEAAVIAREGCLQIIMDRCIMKVLRDNDH
ncbi:MAG: CoA-binding protein [Thermoleophilia bacterium]